MTDKTMPTTTRLLCKYNHNEDDVDNDGSMRRELYTLVHNNPDYHVIKKSDVDGDVLGALDVMPEYHEDWQIGGYFCEDTILREWFIKYERTIRNALIAQSNPGMVRIPRKVLEGMFKNGSISIEGDTDGAYDCGYDQAINDVLNKEGE